MWNCRKNTIPHNAILPHIQYCLTYFHDQFPPLNTVCTSRRAEQNKHHPYLVTSRYCVSITWTISWRKWPQLFCCEYEQCKSCLARSEAWRESDLWSHWGRKWWNGLEVPCMYCFVAKEQLTKKLGIFFQPHQLHASFGCKTLQLASLKAFIFTKVFTNSCCME